VPRMDGGSVASPPVHNIWTAANNFKEPTEILLTNLVYFGLSTWNSCVLPHYFGFIMVDYARLGRICALYRI
jgi:hypothetical protein